MDAMSATCWLGIETSTRRGQVALAVGGAAPVVRTLAEHRRNAAELLPAIQSLLLEAGHDPSQIDVVAYSCGPGSFTGLRIACTVARILCDFGHARAIAVPTLEALAVGALGHVREGERIVALIDARTRGAYAAAYERTSAGRLVERIPAGVFALEQLGRHVGRGALLVGEARIVRAAAGVLGGVRVEPALLGPPAVRQVLTVARARAARGGFTPSPQIRPLYIRPPECEEVYEQRRAAARARRGS